MKNKPTLLTVSRDAGGAEILSSYIKHAAAAYSQVLCVTAGPAKGILRRKGLSRHISSTKIGKKYVSTGRADIVIASTSMPSGLESDFIRLAKKKNIKTAVLLDHWLNYKERFGYPAKRWQENLPDEIWVTDALACSIAKKEFKGNIPVKTKPNFYFADLADEYKRTVVKKDIKTVNVLFLGDMFSEDRMGRAKGAEELIESLKAMSLQDSARISVTLRPHPAEKIGLYRDLTKKYNSSKLAVRLSMPVKTSLLEDIKRADIIIGAYSAALVTAHSLGKKVLCCADQLPFWIKDGNIDYIGDDIRKISDHISRRA